MTVVAIHVGARTGESLRPVSAVHAVAGKGLEGDRHFHPGGAGPGEALTLVDEAVVEDAGLPAGATRRQLTIRGVDLGELIGRRFRAGSVACYGVRLCEPCLHLQKLTRPGLMRELIHRAGINADILTTGQITIGDPIVQHIDSEEQMSTSTTSNVDYTRRLRFEAPPERVFDALTTPDGLAGWWTTIATGTPGAGGTFELAFDGLDEKIVMRVENANRPSTVLWTCLKHTGHPEWERTTIEFALAPTEPTSGLLNFRHIGLIPALTCYETCETGWEHFLSSLINYAEKGEGIPF